MRASSGVRICPQAGWALLSGDPVIMQCYASEWDARYYSEAGAAAAILAAGWTLDSLQQRYQGVDWRDPANWGCNAR